jgi:hypothetical protein
MTNIHILSEHTLCSITSFENSVVHEIMWKNVVEQGRPQMTVWRTCIACSIPRATTTPRLCSTYSFSTAAVVARMNLNVMLHILFLSCLTFAILLVAGLIVKRDA